MKHAVGLDIGGTKITAALVDPKGNIRRKVTYPTPKGKIEILRAIDKAVSLVSEAKSREISGIGVGIPGVLDRKSGKIVQLPNIPALNGFRIGDFLKKTFHKKIFFENDAKCAALGEYRFGVAKGAENLVCLTLGTGIGGGAIIGRKLYFGRGSAPEPGHLTVEPYGRKCHCGKYGCLEEYASGRAITRYSVEEGLKCKTPIEVEELAKQDNKKAIRVFNKFSKYLGIGIGNAVKLYDPEVIVLAGGLSKAHNLFLKQTIKEAKERTFFKIGDILVSNNPSDSGVLGAAFLAL